MPLVGIARETVLIFFLIQSILFNSKIFLGVAMKRGLETNLEEKDKQQKNNYQHLGDNEVQNAFFLAIQDGTVKELSFLLQDERVDPTANNNNAIRLAALNGHLAVVELLLQDERVDPAADNNCAIRVAAEKGHLKVVALLLRSGKVNLDSISQDSLTDNQKNMINMAANVNADFDMAKHLVLIEKSFAEVTLDSDDAWKTIVHKDIFTNTASSLLFSKQAYDCLSNKPAIPLQNKENDAKMRIPSISQDKVF
jgi:ankyrin repeat protein